MCPWLCEPCLRLGAATDHREAHPREDGLCVGPGGSLRGEALTSSPSPPPHLPEAHRGGVTGGGVLGARGSMTVREREPVGSVSWPPLRVGPHPSCLKTRTPVQPVLRGVELSVGVGALLQRVPACPHVFRVPMCSRMLPRVVCYHVLPRFPMCPQAPTCYHVLPRFPVCSVSPRVPRASPLWLSQA